MDKELLSIKDLIVEYSTIRGVAKAVNGVSLTINRGEVFCLVGESGCGKSTLGLSILRLLPKSGKIINGQIIIKGQNILELSEKIMNEKIRGKEITMITQNPQRSLNPVFKISDQIIDVLRFHEENRDQRDKFKLTTQSSRKKVIWKRKAIDMLDKMRIADAGDRMREYPHQFSGGMKQRVIAAMAFISNPSLLIADEPTTSLDVTIEAQIINLLKGLVKEYRTAVLYITHDLGVAWEISDQIAVMYAGNIVERANAESLFKKPQHPYTKALLKCLPGTMTGNRMRKKQLNPIPGQVPNFIQPPPGCRFHPRCPYSIRICKEQQPILQEISSGHFVACFKRGTNNNATTSSK